MTHGTLHILPDTNQALHWQRLDQFDWCAITGAKSCIIEIAPALLRELEEQKVHNRQARLRERAAAIVRWLAELSDQTRPIMLRKNVELRFIDHEPLIDFRANKLSERLADDHLIAAALELASEITDAVGIASGDTGMKVKLLSRPIEHIPLPDQLKLPAEQDAEQKEIRELRAKVARMENRLPSLTVALSDGSEFITIDMAREFTEVPSLDEVKRMHPVLPPELKSYGPRLGTVNSVLGNQDRNAAYNERLEAYYDEYRKYLVAVREWKEVLARSFSVGFLLVNDGRAPASDIDVEISFPSGISVMTRRQLPKLPPEPKPPVRGISALQAAFASSRHIGLDLYGPLAVNNDGTATIREDQQSVRYSVATLKHDYQHKLDEIVVVFQSQSTPHNFDVTWIAHCAETDRQNGVLNFVMKNV